MWPKVPNKSTRAFVGVPTCFFSFSQGTLKHRVKMKLFGERKKFFCWRASFWNFFNRKALVFSHSFASCRVNFNENLWVWYPFNFFQKLKEVSLSFLQLENRKSSLKKSFLVCRILPFLFLIRRLRSSSSFPKDVNLTFIKCPKSKPINPFEIGKNESYKKRTQKEMEKASQALRKNLMYHKLCYSKVMGWNRFFFYSHLAAVWADDKIDGKSLFSCQD